MNPKMKAAMAQKLLNKISSLNPADIEALTIQLVMKGAPMENKSEDSEEYEEDEEDYEEDEEEYDEKKMKKDGKVCPACGKSPCVCDE